MPLTFTEQDFDESAPFSELDFAEEEAAPKPPEIPADFISGIKARTEAGKTGLEQFASVTGGILQHPLRTIQKGGAALLGLTGAISPEEYSTAIKQIEAPPPLKIADVETQHTLPGKVMGGAAQIGVDFLNAFMDPDVAFQVGLGGISPAAQKAILGKFAADMAISSPQQLQEGMEALKQNDIQGAVAKLGGGIAQTALSAKLGREAMTAPGGIRVVSSEAIPEVPPESITERLPVKPEITAPPAKILATPEMLELLPKPMEVPVPEAAPVVRPAATTAEVLGKPASPAVQAAMAKFGIKPEQVKAAEPVTLNTPEEAAKVLDTGIKGTRDAFEVGFQATKSPELADRIRAMREDAVKNFQEKKTTQNQFKKQMLDEALEIVDQRWDKPMTAKFMQEKGMAPPAESPKPTTETVPAYRAAVLIDDRPVAALTGEPGHQEIINRLREEAKKSGDVDLLDKLTEPERGFVDQQGNFLTRSELSKVVDELKGQPAGTTKKAHSYMLPEINELAAKQAKPPAAAPAEPVKPAAEPLLPSIPEALKPSPEAQQKAAVASQAGVPPPQDRPLGIVSPTTSSFYNAVGNLLGLFEDLPAKIRKLWRSAAMKQAPRMTDSNRTTGEKAVRYAASFFYAREKGLEFAGKVLQGVDDRKLGVALSEDNLRSVKDGFTAQANEAKSKGLAEDAAQFEQAANAVRSLIGAQGSPFATEAEYQAFLADPATQAAIERHKQLWTEQKDPLFRQANDLDPDTPLTTRGKQTGARINLKAINPEDPATAPVGRTGRGFRQLATLKRRDPFARRATGMGQAYEGSYSELMANGFERELPVATQHEFIKALIESGDARVTDREVMPDLELKGEPTTGRLLRLNPWKGKFLHVRKSLLDEFDSISGLDKPLKIPILSAFNDVMTHQSIVGFAEGSTHSSNLMTQLFTGLGPTSNPLLNALIKSLGRVDLLYQIPRMVIKGFTNQREHMMKLAEISAAKEPYRGAIASRILNPVDQGVRIVSADIYKQMAKAGWVEDTETGLREYVNQAGNYNKRLQPLLIRKLRESGVQPFATAMQTFNILGVRRLAMAPGAKATSNAAALALKLDIAGGWVGAAVLIAMLNKLVSGKVTGPAGTPLGAVGWTGDDGKNHSINVLRLLGYERGLRITGISPYAEAAMKGLPPRSRAEAAGQAIASTGLSAVMGPGPRAAFVAGTGLRPTMPSVREAPVVPPTDSLNPLKTQLAKNIETALIEANPLVSSTYDLYSGKGMHELAKKQFSRYAPTVGPSERMIAVLPKIVTKRQLNDYVDDVAKEARKLPMGERRKYVNERLASDAVEARYRNEALDLLKRKGIWKYR